MHVVDIDQSCDAVDYPRLVLGQSTLGHKHTYPFTMNKQNVGFYVFLFFTTWYKTRQARQAAEQSEEHSSTQQESGSTA